jgi:hypothetical protein
MIAEAHTGIILIILGGRPTRARFSAGRQKVGHWYSQAASTASSPPNGMEQQVPHGRGRQSIAGVRAPLPATVTPTRQWLTVIVIGWSGPGRRMGLSGMTTLSCGLRAVFLCDCQGRGSRCAYRGFRWMKACTTGQVTRIGPPMAWRSSRADPMSLAPMPCPR